MSCHFCKISIKNWSKPLWFLPFPPLVLPPHRRLSTLAPTALNRPTQVTGVWTGNLSDLTNVSYSPRPDSDEGVVLVLLVQFEDNTPYLHGSHEHEHLHAYERVAIVMIDLFPVADPMDLFNPTITDPLQGQPAFLTLDGANLVDDDGSETGWVEVVPCVQCSFEAGSLMDDLVTYKVSLEDAEQANPSLVCLIGLQVFSFFLFVAICWLAFQANERRGFTLHSL
jgi:hypothetical protein